MRKMRLLLTGIALGAGSTYFFDPQCGNRRRSLARDRGRSMLRRAGLWLEKAIRDLRHRVAGSVAAAKGMFDSRTPSDAQLIERVRARMGHIASYPKLIEVAAHDGRITLSGHAPADEIGPLSMGISMLRGVRSVNNQLEDHVSPDLAAHNGRWRAAPAIDVLRETWAPGTRLAIGTIGSLLMTKCALRPTPKNVLIGTLGFGLLARAVSNHRAICMIEEGGKMALPLLDPFRKPKSTPAGTT